MLHCLLVPVTFCTAIVSEQCHRFRALARRAAAPSAPATRRRRSHLSTCASAVCLSVSFSSPAAYQRCWCRRRAAGRVQLCSRPWRPPRGSRQPQRAAQVMLGQGQQRAGTWCTGQWSSKARAWTSPTRLPPLMALLQRTAEPPGWCQQPARAPPLPRTVARVTPACPRCRPCRLQELPRQGGAGRSLWGLHCSGGPQRLRQVRRGERPAGGTAERRVVPSVPRPPQPRMHRCEPACPAAARAINCRRSRRLPLRWVATRA